MPIVSSVETGAEVITITGVLLGWVRKLSFTQENQQVLEVASSKYFLLLLGCLRTGRFIVMFKLI